MERLEGRVAFITGGARGIGLGIARALAQNGVKLALVDIDRTALNAAHDELSASSPTTVYQLDVRDREAYAHVADEVEATLGPVSLLFNNAGVAGEPPTDQLTYEIWDWTLGINVFGVVNGIQTFLPRLISRGGDAYIVNTASGAGVVMAGAGLAYTTSKFAVVGLSEALRQKLAPRGIGVSVLCPGYVATGIAKNSASLRPSRGSPPSSAPVSAHAAAKRSRAAASFAGGASIDAVGEMVIAAMRARQFYIFTDDMVGEFVERRNAEIGAALARAPRINKAST
ncbi:MAG: SDR family NAD(P)-dependent oxidoreductase [Hydrogenophilaceae bacterium]|jgi:NAD(P)-dependent dehydrogenase (short-subunit alcohol dehydrogenase family)|nr:SDR family NAD(P)-dependent oxidoreductase [Hydrogenophilaceae bacterium]